MQQQHQFYKSIPYLSKNQLMKKLIIICLCFLSISSFGQNVVSINGTNIIEPANKTNKKVIDSATLTCAYLFSRKKDGADRPYRIDTMLLDIGSKVSRFYDPARIGRDALLSEKIKSMNTESIKSVSVFKGDKAKDLSDMPGTVGSPNNEGESYQLYKDRASKKITVIDHVSAMGDKFRYEDEIGTLPWKITDIKDTIQNYVCQKATVHFRGRDYTAWFAPDIPVSDGPWKFTGLPGLILKVEDSSQLFVFSLIGLQQLSAPTPILTDDPKKTIKCTRAEFEKQKKKQGAGTQINMNGGNVIISDLPVKVDYLQMEIE